MPEWPEDLLVGVDRPRRLPRTLYWRLEDALLDASVSAPEEAASGAEPSRALGDELSARLEDELADPLVAVFADVDAPRPVPAATRHALTRTLSTPARHGIGGRGFGRLGAAAAGVVVLAGAGIGLAVAGGGGSSSSSQASRSLEQRAAAPVPPTTHLGPLTTTQAGVDNGGLRGSASAAAPSPMAAAGPGPSVSAVSPDRGPAAGGTWVTVSGTGLSSATAVHFGALAAVSFTVVSDTEMRAEAPPQAPGTVDVVVTGGPGPSPTGPADRFTYSA